MANFPGTPGPDFFVGGDEDDTISGLGGDDFLIGGGGADHVDGGADNDELQGGAGDDTLLGGAGLDSLSGDAGADTLTGGTEADRFSWRVGATASTFPLRDVVTDFEGAGAAGGDTLELSLPFDIPRRLVFEGQLAAMPSLSGTLSFGGNGFTEVFVAHSGGNTYVLADSNDDGLFDAGDFAVQLVGQHSLVRSDFGATPFVIRGTNGADVINGTAGADTIFALGGADTVNGGAGNDVIDGGAGDDRLNGEAGRDRINGGNGVDMINGGVDGDFLSGDSGSDVVQGGAGNDSVAGGDGSDVVDGGNGNDNVDGDNGADLMRGGAGEDYMVGGDGYDVMFGEADADFLQGGRGRDRMVGGAGDDELVGYEEFDVSEGGAGDDRFGFFLGTFAPSSTFAASDLVLDFEGAGVAGGDVIYLNFESVSFAGRFTANPVRGAALPGAGDGVTQLGYAQRGGDTWLIADENDNGRLDDTDFAVRFEGIQNFTRDDFVRTDFVTVGTVGNDVMTGTEGSDRVFAAGGDDQVFGLGGARRSRWREHGWWRRCRPVAQQCGQRPDDGRPGRKLPVGCRCGPVRLRH